MTTTVLTRKPAIVLPKRLVSSLEKATQVQFYRTLHWIADRMRKPVQRKFLRAMKQVKSKTAQSALVDAVERGRIDEVIRALRIDQNMTRALEGSITDPLHEVVASIGAAAVKVLPGRVAAELRGSFDMLNPRVTEFLNAYDFNLIQGLTRRSREGVRTVVRDAFEFGGPPKQQAEYIKDLIGLTDQQAVAVRNLRRNLQSAGQSQAFIRRKVKEFGKRLLEQRAFNIARTETIRAANTGQKALWEQAVDEGLLNLKKTNRVWIVTPDDRLCPVCRAIPGLNKGGVSMREEFDTDLGPMDGPPAHPFCRCAVGLSFK